MLSIDKLPDELCHFMLFFMDIRSDDGKGKTVHKISILNCFSLRSGTNGDLCRSLPDGSRSTGFALLGSVHTHSRIHVGSLSPRVFHPLERRWTGMKMSWKHNFFTGQP